MAFRGPLGHDPEDPVVDDPVVEEVVDVFPVVEVVDVFVVAVVVVAAPPAQRGSEVRICWP